MDSCTGRPSSDLEGTVVLGKSFAHFSSGTCITVGDDVPELDGITVGDDVVELDVVELDVVEFDVVEPST